MPKLRISHFKMYKNIDETPGQIAQVVRLRIKSGSATSGPPIGPVLGQYAIPISKFCTEFNERTSEFFKVGVYVFVTLYYMVDGSYNFSLGLPISSICLSRAVKLIKSTGNPKCRNTASNRVRMWRRLGAMSQYMLYEILLYIYEWSEHMPNQTMRSVYAKLVGTLQSVGIIPYRYRLRKKVLHNV